MNAPLVDTNHSPYARLRPVGVREVTLKRGLLKERQSALVSVSIPEGWSKLQQTHTLDNFDIAAGTKSGPIAPPVFRDSDAYKWIEAASFALLCGADSETESWISQAIGQLEAAQQSDGYLNTHFSGERLALRFESLRNDHELYCAGHLFQAAVAHFRVTGSDRLLRVACRFADLLVTEFGPEGRFGACGHPEAEMGLVELYRATRCEAYLVLAERMLRARGQKPSTLTGVAPSCTNEYFQDHQPLVEQEAAVGHAVRAVYLYAGAADLVAETGDPEFRSAIDALWTDLFTRKMYVTGGLGARHEGESLGAAYELPNERAYSETCAAIGGYMFSYRMLMLEPDARYADTMELALYNSILTGVSLDGTRFFYHNPLESRGGVERQSWFDCACCPPNLQRTIASIGGTLFSRDDDGLWLHLYAACSLHTELPDGRRLSLAVDTDYPWDGRVTLRPSPGRYRLALRIPGWTRSARITVNGCPAGVEPEPGSYAEIAREWSEGDELVLELDMPVELILCNARVDNNRRAGALKRGPLVYCLEGLDCHGAALGQDLIRLSALPEGLRRGDSWFPEAVNIVGTIDATSASSDLYLPRDRRPVPVWRTVEATFVPYFTWANRGSGPMSVWFEL